jgi:hypothetical protein
MRPLSFTVRLRMTRTAHAFATMAVLASSPALGVSACTDLGNAATWVPAMTHEAAYIFVGRVTAVISLSADLGTQVAVLEVQTTLKGSPTFHRVRNTRMGPNFQLMFGEVRVFFVDRHQTIMGCSDYPGNITDRVLREVELALHGSAT